MFFFIEALNYVTFSILYNQKQNFETFIFTFHHVVARTLPVVYNYNNFNVILLTEITVN